MGVSILLLAVLRTKGVVAGPQSGDKELWPEARVQFPGGVGTEQAGGHKVGNSGPKSGLGS